MIRRFRRFYIFYMFYCCVSYLSVLNNLWDSYETIRDARRAHNLLSDLRSFRKLSLTPLKTMEPTPTNTRQPSFRCSKDENALIVSVLLERKMISGDDIDAIKKVIYDPSNMYQHVLNSMCRKFVVRWKLERDLNT